MLQPFCTALAPKPPRCACDVPLMRLPGSFSRAAQLAPALKHACHQPAIQAEADCRASSCTRSAIRTVTSLCAGPTLAESERLPANTAAFNSRAGSQARVVTSAAGLPTSMAQGGPARPVNPFAAADEADVPAFAASSTPTTTIVLRSSTSPADPLPAAAEVAPGAAPRPVQEAARHPIVAPSAAVAPAVAPAAIETAAAAAVGAVRNDSGASLGAPHGSGGMAASPGSASRRLHSTDSGGVPA